MISAELNHNPYLLNTKSSQNVNILLIMDKQHIQLI